MAPMQAGTPMGSTVASEQVESVVAATRVVGGLIAESLAKVDPPVTMPQWRVLVLTSQEPRNVSAVAEDLDVHPSNATRICDRLVNAGLLERRRDPSDRRQVLLNLTPQGRRLFETAMRDRRERVERAMSRMGQEQRAVLAGAMEAFAVALEADHADRAGA